MRSASEPDPVFGGVGERGIELSQMVPGLGLKKLPTEAWGQIEKEGWCPGCPQMDDLLDMGNSDKRMGLMEFESLGG